MIEIGYLENTEEQQEYFKRIKIVTSKQSGSQKRGFFCSLIDVFKVESLKNKN